MKYSFFVVVAFCTLISACKEEPKAVDAVDVNTLEDRGRIVDGKLDAASQAKLDSLYARRNLPKPAPGIVGEETQQVQQVVGMLTRNYWFIEAYVRMGDNDKRDFNNNRGRWYKFNPDFTYTTGKYMEQTGKGKWSFDGSQAYLHLDQGSDSINSEFVVKLNYTGEVMVFVGTDRYLQNNTQIKLLNFEKKVAEWPTDLPN